MVYNQESGKIHVRGAPDQAKEFTEIAHSAYTAHNLPDDLEPGLEEPAFYDPANFSFPNSAHFARVKIDPDTGENTIQRYVAVDEAISLIRDHGDATLIARGHSLLPVMKLRLADPGTFVDIGCTESLKGISHGNDHSRIGALTVHATVERDSSLPRILSEAASWIGDLQVRNRGTVGGNVAHTVIILREKAGVSSAYAKLFDPASRYAIVGAGAVFAMDGDTCTEAHVAVDGLTPKAMRTRSVEQALTGRQLTDNVLRQAATQGHEDSGDDLIGDIRASAEYRREVAPTFVLRALKKARERAA